MVTHDLDALIDGYLFDWWDESGRSRAAPLSAWRRSTTARFLFNEEDLRAALEDACFVEIRRFTPSSGTEPVFWDLEPADASLLVLEANKPR